MRVVMNLWRGGMMMVVVGQAVQESIETEQRVEGVLFESVG